MNIEPTGACVWSCLAYEPPEHSMKEILKSSEASLFLVYVHDAPIYSGSYCRIAHADLFAKRLTASLAATTERLMPVPLCAATIEVRTTGGKNWTPCQAKSTFPDPQDIEKEYLPYALWLLAVGASMPDECVSKDTSERFMFADKLQPKGSADNIVQAEIDKEVKEVQLTSLTANSILAQALAVEWLLKYRKAAVMSAIGSQQITTSASS